MHKWRRSGMSTPMHPRTTGTHRALGITVAAALVLGLVGTAKVAGGGPPRSGDVAVQEPSDVPDPAGPGPYAVGRTTFTVVDPARGDRRLTTDVWYPSDAAAVSGVPMSEIDLVVARIQSPTAHDNPSVSRASPGGFPLVVFSHGAQTIRFQSYDLMEFLASHGYVVAAPDHAGNTMLDARFGSVTPLSETLRNRPLDLSAVIDTMLERNATGGDLFEGTIDDSRVAVSGDSVGGWTALVMRAGFRDVAAGTDVAPDPRVRATVALSPFLGFFGPDALPPLKGPAMIIGGTSDSIAPVGVDSERAFALLPSRRRFRVDIHEAGHGSFSNVCEFKAALDASAEPVGADVMAFVNALAGMSCAESIRPQAEVQHIIDHYTLVFLNRVLDDDDRYQKHLSRGFSRRFPIDYFRGDDPRPLPS
jgi:predicted dienelactone hydrolase